MPDNVPCKWCGMEMPADANKCPWCYRAPPRAAPPPTPPVANDAPPEPVIGQEEFGTLASLGSLARHDPAMFAVVLLIGVSCILSLLDGDWLGFIISAVVLWGILQWTWWALWLVALGQLLNIAWGIRVLIVLGLGWTGPQVMLGIGLAIDVFVFVVVIMRRDRFD